MPLSAFDAIVGYHRATKHHLHRYARSAGYMDWSNQPDPFRAYAGAESTPLPLSTLSEPLPFDDLFRPVDRSPQPLTLKRLGAFLQRALGISAWKVAGASRWALRANPSSGNLHPTEGHIVIPPLEEMAAGVYHYAPLQHALEKRSSLSASQWERLEAHFGGPGLLVALSSIFWRESWKYGERAFRYCQLDIGHALAALSFSARLHHWRLTCIPGAGDDQIGVLLGFDRTDWQVLEEEIPELLCWVSTNPEPGLPPKALEEELVQMFASLAFDGRPRPLGGQPLDWPIIREAARVAKKPPTPAAAEAGGADPLPSRPRFGDAAPAADVIARRRSAVRFDPQRSVVSADGFRTMLALTLPQAGVAPFSAGLMPPMVDLLIFVHRVQDLESGLYLLSRSSGRRKILQSAWRREWEWSRVWSDFPLWRLQKADLTFEAMEASCHQEIAAHSAFAVAMLACFKEVLQPAPHRYRHLHWECGMVGQVLYLAAEAHDLRGTGIGCFFDDVVHEMVGIEDLSFQNLYHFTVGHPIEDARLTTLPGYHHRSHR